MISKWILKVSSPNSHFLFSSQGINSQSKHESIKLGFGNRISSLLFYGINGPNKPEQCSSRTIFNWIERFNHIYNFSLFHINSRSNGNSLFHALENKRLSFWT